MELPTGHCPNTATWVVWVEYDTSREYYFCDICAANLAKVDIKKGKLLKGKRFGG